MFSQALYHAWGPHQRVSAPSATLGEKPESEWSDAALLAGVWTIFPHVSIAGFDGGGRGVMLSQLFPGDAPGKSYTVQNYLLEREPVGDEIAEANAQFAFLERVVRDEDYATGLKQQRALATGAKSHVLFGRNEGGGQRFHRFLDALLATPDDRLETFLKEGAQQ
jgi:ring hydroxylating enzyme alpha subunit